MFKERIAYVFPGQGLEMTQVAEIGKYLYLNFLSGKETFREADDALGFEISKICFEGSKAELIKTSIAQPLILIISIAGLRVASELQDLKGPLFLAGHSLGEYTALVVADSLTFRDGVWLVYQRGKLMEEANEKTPGGMIVVLGLDEVTLEGICQEVGIEIANINAPGQIVISGPQKALPQASDLAIARGAKRIMPLNTGGAFHSQLMVPIVGRMGEFLSLVPLYPPKISTVTNTTAIPMRTVPEVKEELLRQPYSRVEWVKSIEYILGKGVSTFIEIGPGQVLSGLINRINPEVETINLKFEIKG